MTATDHAVDLVRAAAEAASDKLAENITAFVDQVRHAKPAGVRGNYIESVTVSATMSPGIRVAV